MACHEPVDLGRGGDQAIARTGSRAARLELLETAADWSGLQRAEARSALADTDLTDSIAQMQQLPTALQATCSRVIQLLLFHPPTLSQTSRLSPS